MSYKKPICDCGQELFIYREDVAIIETTINKNGMPNKKSSITLDKTINRDRLECNKCSSGYEMKIDEKGRIVRGNKYY